jgi:hypothetical protein
VDAFFLSVLFVAFVCRVPRSGSSAELARGIGTVAMIIAFFVFVGAVAGAKEEY